MSIDNIEKSFHSFFLRNNIPTDAKFLIAVSGGVDSMTCLALALKLNLKIAVAHVCKFQKTNSNLSALS